MADHPNASAVTREAVLAALKGVKDPDLGRDLVDLGMVKNVQIDDSTLQLEGESTFDIRDFGMEPPRILLLRVHPEVKVRVAIVATKE